MSEDYNSVETRCTCDFRGSGTWGYQISSLSREEYKFYIKYKKNDYNP